MWRSSIKLCKQRTVDAEQFARLSFSKLSLFSGPSSTALQVREIFVSQERVSGFQRKGLTSEKVRELPGKFGELPGKSGKLPGNLWIAVKFHSERACGEVAEKLQGKFGELPGKSGNLPSSGEPDSHPVTPHICFESRAAQHHLATNDDLSV